ncbi:MAG: alpha/beta hydrolase [Cyanobacteriota bacterium]|nr:alpha/beta hydrolase [Cyanobacteriota bacterium]
MAAPDAPPQVIAMHGWVGDSSQWRPWREAATALGWSWCSGERGYGDLPPVTPRWQPAGRRLVIVHSLGLHLLPAEVLATADAVVLLASFGRFVPPGRAGRSLKAALAGMAAALADPHEARAMLRRFLVEAAAPDPIEAMPPGPADAALSASGLERLRADLALLERSEGVPEPFPRQAPTLVVEAGADRVVVPAARALLREELPGAAVIELANAGHALLTAPVLDPVLDWLRRPRER